MTRTLLVTGGAGFIGASLIRQILDHSTDRVVVVDRLSYAGRNPFATGAEPSGRVAFHRVDVRDREAVGAILDTSQPDAVMHLAAETHVDRSIDDPSPFVEHNVVATEQLLRAVDAWLGRAGAERRAGFRLLYASTDEVYGSWAAGEATEAAALAPSSPYAATKAAGELVVRAFAATYGVPAIIARSTNNYGPFQFPEKLIPLLILKALAGETFPLYGDGQQERDWLWVDDHSRALLTMLTQAPVGATFNVGTGLRHTNLAVAEALADLLDELTPGRVSHRARIRFVADRPGHDRRYAVDATLVQQSLGWKPEVAFADGLRRTVEWYLAHRDWLAPIAASVYGGERLGAGT